MLISSLGTLLALELHLYADACAEIVDRAHKELTIEKQISKIEATWAVLSLTFAPYQVLSLFLWNASIILLYSSMCADDFWNASRRVLDVLMTCILQE